MTYASVRGFVRHLHRTGALSVSPDALEVAIRDFVEKENHMHLTSDNLRHRFSFHPARTEEKQERHETVREACLVAAETIVDVTGAPSREQSTAITKLEEAMFWANAAIAREVEPVE